MSIKNPIAEPGRVYKALISQDSLSAPTVTVLPGNTIGNIVWTRLDVGVYIGTLAGAFAPNNRVKLLMGTVHLGFASGVSPIFAFFQSDTEDTVTIQTTDITGVYLDSSNDVGLRNTYIEIRVYP